MSWVANVMLSVGWDDRANADAFSAWLDAERGYGSLVPITGPDARWGGYKRPECLVYAGALNHADLDAVVEHFGAVVWRNPNAAQLFLMDQEESFFRVWMKRGGTVQQYAPLAPDENDDEFWDA
jgi:hypothetical protein